MIYCVYHRGNVDYSAGRSSTQVPSHRISLFVDDIPDMLDRHRIWTGRIEQSLRASKAVTFWMVNMVREEKGLELHHVG